MEKIVVGIDGPDSSKDALRWAVEDARARGAEVVALHAYEVPVPAPDAAPAPPVDLPALVAEAHGRHRPRLTTAECPASGDVVTSSSHRYTVITLEPGTELADQMWIGSSPRYGRASDASQVLGFTAARIMHRRSARTCAA